MKTAHWLCVVFFLTLTRLAHAVAGGAGGGGSYSGGGGFSGGYSGSYSSSYDGSYSGGVSADFLLIFFFFIIIVVIFTTVAIQKGHSYTKITSDLDALRLLKTKSRKSIEKFCLHNPDFSEKIFIDKASFAFVAIQSAWSRQNLSDVRRWISDGIWQRFHTQFIMMELLGQKNFVNELGIKDIFITHCEQDGVFDVIDVAIHFIANDQFISTPYPNLSQSGYIEMVEFWSFIRKSGVKGGDLYSNNKCPSCGAELPQDMGEVARCPHCSAISTLGDYDWILSEITQADDYFKPTQKTNPSAVFVQQVRQHLSHDKNFSLQLMEDKASNAFMQIMTAMVTKNFSNMHRFVTDEFFNREKKAHLYTPAFVFNRLYLNQVSVIDYYRTSKLDHIAVEITCSAQRVDISNQQLRFIDLWVKTSSVVMILSRKIDALQGKGSVYAFTCPACGAPLGETTEQTCRYCNAVINSMEHEWIVSHLFPSVTHYYLALRELKSQKIISKVHNKTKISILSVSDYALNNLLMLMARDGLVTPEEKAAAHQLAKKFGYNPEKLNSLFQLAQNGQLSLRLPADKKAAKKVRDQIEAFFLTLPNRTQAENDFLAEINRLVESDDTVLSQHPYEL